MHILKNSYWENINQPESVPQYQKKTRKLFDLTEDLRTLEIVKTIIFIQFFQVKIFGKFNHQHRAEPFLFTLEKKDRIEETAFYCSLLSYKTYVQNI